MKFVIDTGTTKRELSGSFAICASVEDLRHLQSAINAGIQKAIDEGVCYGWLVQVHPPIRNIGGSPMGWD